MPGKFEGMSGAEWELAENIFPGKAEKGRCLFLGGRLPLVRSSAGHPRALAEGMAFRRKAQGIAGRTVGDFFSLRKRSLIHFPAAAEGRPLPTNEDERKHVGKLLETAGGGQRI